MSALEKRYKAYVKIAKQAEAAKDWRGAAVDYYAAYCEHPSKWEAEPSAEQTAEREALMRLCNSNWTKHLEAFEIGTRVRIPSGMGGSWDGECNHIDGERIYIIVDNPQYPDTHGREASAHYRDARRFKT